MNGRTGAGRLVSAVTYCLLGGAATAFGIIIAVRFVDPPLRHAFGNPYGYDFDYTTLQAWIYAAFIRVSCIAFAFSIIGLFLRNSRQTSTKFLAVAVGNPVSIFLGLFCCSLLKHLVDVRDSSFGMLGYVIIALLSPLLLAPFVLLGRNVGNKLRPHSA